MKLVAAAVLAAVLVPVACARDERSEAGFRSYAGGFDSPVYVATTPTEPGKLYVVEQPGTIQVLVNGKRRATPFLDIRSLVRSGGEQGLLSMAFHPDYAERHLFYVDYTDLNGDTRVVQDRASDGQAVLSSAKQLLFVDQPYANHNGGQLQFGPDGLLYVGMGDGGSAGDPERRAQNLASPLGKLLRTNVAAAKPAWKIAGYGLRNPWRFSFDKQTSDLWIADVGQGDWEEVDYRPRNGLNRMWNYGWSVYEGRHKFSDHPLNSRAPLVMPVAQYSHSEGCSITGGYVYRGAAAPSLRGRYFYGDYCSGNLWTARRSGGRTIVTRFRGTIDELTSFGQGSRGELYAVSGKGTIYRLAG
jgi:glucose/arabinose dehydrogenase